MGADLKSINWIEAAAWIGLTVLLLGMLGAALRHVWADKVRRIEALEAWRERREVSETAVLLAINSLQNETKSHTKVLERMEKQLADVAVLVGNHRREVRPWHPEALRDEDLG